MLIIVFSFYFPKLIKKYLENFQNMVCITKLVSFRLEEPGEYPNINNNFFINLTMVPIKLPIFSLSLFHKSTCIVFLETGKWKDIIKLLSILLNLSRDLLSVDHLTEFIATFNGKSSTNKFKNDLKLN